MANLKQYQIKALTQEIYNRIQDTEDPKTQTKEYKSFVKRTMKDASAIAQEIEDLQVVLSAKKQALRDIIGRSYYSSNITLAHEVEKLANKEFSITNPTMGEIERTIILCDLNGSDDVVKTVMEKLGYKNE